jgi:hypothetical protein
MYPFAVLGLLAAIKPLPALIGWQHLLLDGLQGCKRSASCKASTAGSSAVSTAGAE